MANNFDILPGYDHVVVTATLWERLLALMSCYQTLKYSFMGESNPRQLPILDSESVVYQSLIINPWPLCHSNLCMVALQRLVATKLSNTRLWSLKIEWCPLIWNITRILPIPLGRGPTMSILSRHSDNCVLVQIFTIWLLWYFIFPILNWSFYLYSLDCLLHIYFF